MNGATWTAHSYPRRRLALAFLVPMLAAAAAATSLVLAGSESLSSHSPVAAVASAPAWTPFASPFAQAPDVRDLKRQLVRAGYQVKVDDSLDPVAKSAFADYLRPGTARSLSRSLAVALRGTVLLGRQNPVLWNRRFGLDRPTKLVERPLTGRIGQLDANGNIRALVIPAARAGAAGEAARNGKIAFVNRARTRLNVINPNGSGLRRLARCPAAITNCVIGGYAWSPNGKHLAFVRGHVGGAITTSNLSLFVVDARGRHVRRLARCGGSCHMFWTPLHLSWSRDSRKIVFAADDGIRVVDRLTGAGSRLTDSARDYAPTWSPDGARIAFDRDNSLYTIRPDGSGLIKAATIPSDGYLLGQPAWAPDGTRIVFDGPDQIYAVGADGSQLTLLRAGPPGSGPGTPSWSPDGSRILFFNTPRTAEGYIAEVWVMDPDGSHARRLYRLPCCVNFWDPPIWSPDGKRVAASADTCLRDCTVWARPGGIVVMDRNGRHRRRLSRSASEIAWQPIPRARTR